MNQVITKNCFLLVCVFCGWWSPSTAETLENQLIKNLEELFIITKGKKNIYPQEHELLGRLERDYQLNNLFVIKSISSYAMIDKSTANAKFPGGAGFQIWKFDNKDNAKWYFDFMKKVVFSDAFYNKPPKCFFLVSGADEIYYFTTGASKYNRYMFRAADKLINCCFAKSELDLQGIRYKDE